MPWYRGTAGPSQPLVSPPASSQSTGSAGGGRTGEEVKQDLEAIVESPTPASTGGGEAGKSPAELSVMHACMHCRAAKTACTDERPCKRCTRLGLECSAYRDEPRKRACVGCHSAKVSCSVKDDGSDTCARCRRLGITCVPRDNATIRGVGVRKSSVLRPALPHPAPPVLAYTSYEAYQVSCQQLEDPAMEELHAVGKSWITLTEEEQQRWIDGEEQDLRRYIAECSDLGVEPVAPSPWSVPLAFYPIQGGDNLLGKIPGFTASQLIEAGFTASQLKVAGYNHLNSTGLEVGKSEDETDIEKVVESLIFAVEKAAAAEAAAAAAAAAKRARIAADQARLEAACAAAHSARLPFDLHAHSMLRAEPLWKWSRSGPFVGSSAIGETGDFADVDRAVLLQLLVRDRNDLDPYPLMLLMQMSEEKRQAWDEQRLMIAEAHRNALRVFASEATLKVQLEVARLLVGFSVAPLGASKGIGKVATARVHEGEVSLLVEYDEQTMSDEMTVDEVLKGAQGYLPGFDTAAPPAGFGAPPCAPPAAPLIGSGAPALSCADAAPDAAPDAASADASSPLAQCTKLQRKLVGLVLTASNSTIAAARMKLLAALTSAEIYDRDFDDICSAQTFVQRIEKLLGQGMLVGDIFFMQQHFSGKWSIQINGCGFELLLRGGRGLDGSLSYMSELAEDFANFVEALLAGKQLELVEKSITRTTFRMSLTSKNTILRLQSVVDVYQPTVIDEKGTISFEGAAILARADYDLADSASVPQIREIQAIAAALATPKACLRISTTLATSARSVDALEEEGDTKQLRGLGAKGTVKREVASNETFQTLTWRNLAARVPLSRQVVTARRGARFWQAHSYEHDEVVGRGDAAGASASARASTSRPASASPAASAATTGPSAVGPSAAADDDDDGDESVRSFGGGDGTAAQAPGVKAAGKRRSRGGGENEEQQQAARRPGARGPCAPLQPASRYSGRLESLSQKNYEESEDDDF